MSAEAKTRAEVKTRLLMKQIKEERLGMIDTTDLEGFVKRTIEQVMQLEKESGIDMTPSERESLEAEVKEFVESKE